LGSYLVIGWFNWLNLPFAIVGVILGYIAYKDDQRAAMSYEYGQAPQVKIPLGLILCSIAFIFGLFRLFLGGGII